MAVVENPQFEEFCRICATKITMVSAINIFDTEGTTRQISKKICTCLPIQVQKTDKLPKNICESCLHNLDLFYDFRETSVQSETLFLELYEEFTSTRAHSDNQQSFIVPMDHNELVVVQQHQILDEDSLQLTHLSQGKDAIVKQEIILTHDNVNMNPHSLSSVDVDNHDLSSQDLSNHSFQTQESLMVDSQSDSGQDSLFTVRTGNLMQDQLLHQQHNSDVNMTDVNSGSDMQLTNNYIECNVEQQNQNNNVPIKIECDEIKLEDDESDFVDYHLDKSQEDDGSEGMDSIMEDLKLENINSAHSLLVGEQLNDSVQSSVTDKPVCHVNIEKKGSSTCSSSSKDLYSCVICGKTYEQKSEFEDHYNTHSYKCGTCLTAFSNMNVLMSHRKEAHGACEENTKAESLTQKCDKQVIVDQIQKRSPETLEECKENGKNRKYEKRKDYCFFCKNVVSNFARHLLRNHQTEKEVKKILTYSPKDKTRKKMLGDIRKKGNFLNPAVRKPVKCSATNVNILPCTNCLGYFSAKRLWRHRKKCMGGTSDRLHQVKAQNFLLRNVQVDKLLKDKVFLRMRPDEISMTAKTDELICAFGARYFKSHPKKHYVNVTSRKMRELARLLIEIQKLELSIKSLFDALRSDNFEILVSATKVVAQYNEENESFQSATTALNLGSAIKQCCQIAIVFIIEGKQVHSTLTAAEAEADINALIRLIDSKWHYEISIKASKVLNTKKLLLYCLEKGEVVHYKGKSLDEKSIDLDENENDSSEHEIQPLPRDSEKNSVHSLPGTSQNLSDSVLQLPSDTLTLLSKQRQDLKQKSRRILTPWTDQQKKVVRQFFATHVEKKIAPKKRECLILKDKYATLLNNKDWLKIKVFVQNEYVKRNRQDLSDPVPQHPEQLPTCDKLTSSKRRQDMDKKSASGEHKIQSLLKDTKKLLTGTNQDLSDRVLELPCNTLTLFSKRKQDLEMDSKRILVPWTDQQKKVVQKFFATHIEKNIAPKKQECLIVKDKYETLLKNKDWVKIKVFVQNEYVKQNCQDIKDPALQLPPCNTLTSVSKLRQDVDKNSKRILVPWTSQQKKVVRQFFATHIRKNRAPIKHDCLILKDKYETLLKNKDWLKIKVFVQNEYVKRNRYH